MIQKFVKPSKLETKKQKRIMKLRVFYYNNRKCYCPSFCRSGCTLEDHSNPTKKKKKKVVTLRLAAPPPKGLLRNCLRAPQFFVFCFTVATAQLPDSKDGRSCTVAIVAAYGGRCTLTDRRDFTMSSITLLMIA